MPLQLDQTLNLARCPHCSVASPYMGTAHTWETYNSARANRRSWKAYNCGVCGGVVTAYANHGTTVVVATYPAAATVEQTIPDRPRDYLAQAMESRHAPAGAVMLCASAVDAMLKIRGLVPGSLYARIDKAVEDHMLTAEMAQWAHAVRLDANDQRHADVAAALPTAADADRVIDFTVALAEILFVLPGRVQRGLQAPP